MNILPDNAHQYDDGVIYEMIKHRVEELLALDPALLFSYLYRLDISEPAIKIALAGPKPIDALAQLILERQKLRVYTKQKYKTPPVDKEWEW